MRKLLIVALLLNAGLLFAIWQQLSVVAEVGSGGGVSSCEGDPTKYSLDTNADGNVDLSDFVGGLNWFFSGGEAPQVCLATDDLEARIAALETSSITDGEARIATLEATSVPDGEMRLVALEGQHPVDWSSIQNRPSGLDDGDDVGLTSLIPLIPQIAGFTFVETSAEGYPEYTHDASGIRFVRLPGGSFDMGSPVGEEGRSTDEGPVHTVSLSPFLIAKYEVTQAEYASVMTGNTAGLNPTPSTNFGSAPASDQRPVEMVSWSDLRAPGGFLERTGLVLPTEAQWEYAARAGTSGPYAGTGNLDDMGWSSANSGGLTHDVGGKLANQFGLHDMHGNLAEWCEDVYNPVFYSRPASVLQNPLATTGSEKRVYRGGDVMNGVSSCRSAARASITASARFIVSFRPVRPFP